MYSSFAEIESMLLNSGIRKKIVLANAHDTDALEAVVNARRRGVIEAVLIGKTDEIKKILSRLEEPADLYDYIECLDEAEAANLAVSMVKDKKADIPMKGLMQTANFMKALLKREYGFVPEGGLLNQATVLEWPEKNKLMVIGDCAINIAPDLEAKKKIIENMVVLAQKLGYEKPNVAVLSAVEVVKDKIPNTLDAKALSEMEWTNCCVGGPFALDNAVSPEAARHKGITHPVAGNADIMLMPDLSAGNIFTKGLTFFAHLKSAGTVCGTASPVIMTSRTDTPEDKYYSILTAIMQSL